jgi:predicted Zn-dependent peptidase
MNTNEPLNRYRFRNGLKLIHQSVGHLVPITSIFVYIKFGSINELERFEKGIAHFIEHMCFKGTYKLKSAIDIVRIYDGIGAYFNAETTKEFTCYKVRCANEHVPNSIKVLSDMIFHSTLKKKDVDLERNVVMEENIRADDDPKTSIENAIYRRLYNGTPYSDPVDDTSFHSTGSLTQKDIVQTYRRFYQPNNMGLSIISNLSFQTIKRLVYNSSFVIQSEIPPQIQFEYRVLESPGIQYELVPKKGISATNLSISFRICKYGYPDMYPLYLLSSILGGYMSSRLFMILREKWGLTYTSKCKTLHHSSYGHFEFYTMCDHKSMMKNNKNPGVLLVILDIIKDLLHKGITQKELADAKGNLKGQFTISMEQSQNKCIHNGMEYIVFDIDEPTQYESLYDKYYASVSKKQINELIRKYFVPENMLVCLVGEHLPALNSIKRTCQYLFP